VKVEAVVGAARGAVGYLVYERPGGPALIVDAPLGSTHLYMKAIERTHVSVQYIVSTHGHWDQIADNAKLAEAIGAAVCAHIWDAPRLADPQLGTEDPNFKTPTLQGRRADQFLGDGQELQVGDMHFTVMHTPGHTPGSLSLYEPRSKALFSGDILVWQGIGRSDFPGGSPRHLQESLTRLASLPDDTRVFPGHGIPTVLRNERWLLDLAKASTT
jgi:hydroxyacylglutathione hydrolase